VEFINEKKVLDFYLEQIEADSIEFLKNKPWYKEDISKEILRLWDEEEMHNKIIICKKLWKLLFEASMSYIDPDRRGYDDLFEYFDEYVNFEELIFASDSFYRDHTMHCLWVYFLGEYIIRNDEFKPCFERYGKENEYIHNIGKLMRESGYIDLFKSFIDLDDMVIELEKYSDPARCLQSLTHDLGYPIKKINSINKNIKSILPHFGIKDFSEFEFNYSDIHDNFIKDFLNFISYSFMLSPTSNQEVRKIVNRVFNINEYNNVNSVNEKEILNLTMDEKELLRNTLRFKTEIFFDYSKHVRYSKDFENYQHGIMSAFLLFRKLAVFNNKQFSYRDYSNLNVRVGDFMKISTLSEILRAITDHTSEGYQISVMGSESSFLTFIDELEEFSRISRANQNRQYINEFCKSSIYVEEGYFNIDFIFDNTQIDNLDPERAFKGRCKRFLTLFNISELDKDFKLKLRCIGNLPYDNNVYILEIRNKFANITINGEEKNIPQYLKSKQFLTKEAYALC
jgi:hypothetical protein